MLADPEVPEVVAGVSSFPPAPPPAKGPPGPPPGDGPDALLLPPAPPPATQYLVLPGPGAPIVDLGSLNVVGS